MTRVLVICPDKTGPLMAGTAIRSVEIARALADDFRVTLAVPSGSAPVAGAMTQVRVPTESTLPPLIAWADVVFVAGRSELMSAIRKPVIVDLYDPFILSDLEFYGARFNAAAGRPLLALRWLQHHLENGDLFVCASAVQRSFWLGMLASAGRVNRANHAEDRGFDDLLAVVPFGVPEHAPVHTRATLQGVHPGFAATDRVVLWAGGLWNWVDPLTLLRAVATIADERPDVKALFLGARHPNPQIGAMEMAADALALARELGLHDRRAFFLDWVPYEDRQNYLLESDVGVSLHQPGVEAQFAFRTRVLDYLWCGLPMVLSRGDELAGMVEREGLGVTVPEGDAAAVAGAITSLLDAAPVDRAARSAAVRETLSWRKVVEPIRRFCAAPRVAPDKTAGGWFEPGTHPAVVLRKEDALISEEFVAPERELSPQLGDDYTVEHEITAAYDNLCRVDLLVWPASPVPAGLLRLTIAEMAADARELARVDVPLAVLPDNDWQRFEFRPIANARGRRYRLTLRACGVAESRIALWLCTSREGVAAPAMVLHYLVKGLVDTLPVATESFLFLHNTTVSETGAPGMTSPAGGEPLAELHNVRDVARVTAPAAGNGTPADSEPPSDGGGAVALAARSTEIDRVRAELARLTVELARTRAELETVGARAAALAEAPALPRLRRDVLMLVGRTLRAVVRAGIVALILVLTLVTVPIAAVLAGAFAAVDVLGRLRSRTGRADAPAPADDAGAAAPRAGTPISVVIPTWNGRDLLAMSLPPLRAALAGYAGGGEIIVVDNGSDDDTREYLARECPGVRVIALPRNEGFAGATNRGVAASAHRTVILLNNDMVVEPDFIAPLLAAFDAEPATFGVSCQIDFLDKRKARWETGKVHAEWRFGTLRLFHLDRFDEDLLYPVFFAGGGASAYDRAKFLALGGFDETVFSPVYIEDVDLGYRAWKRGWPSLIQPRSVVHHKHRGTTRRLWSEATIHSFFVKNLAALVQKNVTDWRLLARHLAGLVVLPLRVLREIGGRGALATWYGLIRQAGRVVRARLREAAVPRVLDDATIFQVARHRYAYRAHFGARRPHAPDARLRILVLTPYSPSPAVHGGAVRMLALLERLARVADITLLSYADTQAELDPESIATLRALCREVVVLERSGRSVPRSPLAPAKTRGFWSQPMADTLEYFLDRDDYDVVQVEYTHMAHFLPPPAPGLVRALVEHDVSFVSLARSLAAAGGRIARLGLRLEWMRMLRYEVAAVERADLVITMSETDRAMLGRFAAVDHTRTIPNGVDCARFRFVVDGRDPETILFVGFFRHEPNVEAVRYFVDEVLPLLRAARPGVRFLVVGAYPPEVVRRLGEQPGIEVTGRVDDIGTYYRSSAVFVAPVLQGSGTRLKILEAMASGCPVVSTTIGAEGLGASDDAELLIRDTPAAMAAAILDLLADGAGRAALARRARAFVEARYDWDAIATRLVAAYREALGPPPAAVAPAPPPDPNARPLTAAAS